MRQRTKKNRVRCEHDSRIHKGLDHEPHYVNTQREGRYYRTAGHWQHDEGYRPAKVKKEKKHKDRNNYDRGARGHVNGGKHED